MLNIVRSEKGHALSVQGDINARFFSDPLFSKHGAVLL